ncbi:hypothetical protein Ocin01_19293 [Orchesella cincta]|uniref:Uncharacterized protein n=1 Tax=Orchesella cincta TaxID=48709 RepID=A0A1D2M333_ORCCI|nr:hypothetical protein Ocin01_19293 [Orchesella cincta]
MVTAPTMRFKMNQS